MNCPHCKNPMLVLELEQVETDYCTDCKGIWLDSGELELLLEDSSDKNELLKLFTETQETKEKKIKCPICFSKMDKIFVSKDKEVIIDECKNGHGLWFDKGEILDVIKIGSVNKENKIVKILTEMYQHKIISKTKEEI